MAELTKERSYSGREYIKNIMSEEIKREVSDEDLNNALIELSTKSKREETKKTDNEKLYLTTLKFLKIFICKYSLSENEFGARIKTTNEVSSYCSASKDTIIKAENTMLSALKETLINLYKKEDSKKRILSDYQDAKMKMLHALSSLTDNYSKKRK